MPKKSKKSAEAEAAEPMSAVGLPGPSESAATEPPPVESAAEPELKAADKRQAAPKKAAAKKPAAKKAPAKKASKRTAKASAEAAVEHEAALDLEDLHRMQGESPATPEGGQAEAAAQAADTFEAAAESNDAGEVSALAIETDTESSNAVTAAAADSDNDDEEDEQFVPAPRPPAKLERLQKIMAQAGIASRRHAEELITEGRVQVNGKIVTELGTKADSSRDHIRVDGKLLQGAERLRYFVLNKPRGFVTTVSDPEGRPTVMQFFSKMGARLYPVGRLDYLSEGLLIVTNDGELANKLTKAASAVEKTYLVKVSGQPTEEQLETLRQGVSIDRGKPGEGRVRTSPARIRQVRVGDNPWYEVVLIEGRNRELRKMFEEIGHFVEKIRRVGYGPLVLDQEPGNLRELDESELKMLRLAADGKWKPKRIKSTAMLPKHAGGTVDPDATKTRPGKPFLPAPGLVRGPRPERVPDRGQVRRQDRVEARPRPENRTAGPGRRPAPNAGGGAGQERPRFQDRGFTPRTDDRGQRPGTGRTFGRPATGGDRRPFSKPPADRAEGRGFSKPPANRGEGRGFTRPPADRGGERRSFSRPPASETGQRPFRDRPATGGTDKPRFDRPAFPSRPPRAEGAGFEARKPFKPRGDRPAGAQGSEHRFTPRPGGKPAAGSFGGDRRRPPQGTGRPFTPRPEGRSGEKPAFPPRREGVPPARTSPRPPAGGRPAFTSSGVPRPGGARPPSSGAGRTGFQGRGRTAGGARPGGGRSSSGGSSSSGPRPGSNGSSRSGFKGKPGGNSGRKRT
jgi:23S rRNA pseudouridine2605 synthase